MPVENTNAGNPPGISESGKHMVGAVRDWLRGVSDLATLEIRYSIQSITAALVVTLVLGAVMFSSWCLVLLAITVAILQAGWGWIPAIFFVLMLNILFAVFLWHYIQTLIERVGMDATRGALGLDITARYDEPVQTHPNT
jgi:hypothetical protein